ncbi:lysine decarboxylase [Hyaloraphidium curvatum]|nr:lysine decarboxylase [Hyaloraphidium curvatum]
MANSGPSPRLLNNVLVADPGLEARGGGGTFIRNLIQELSRAGHVVSPVTSLRAAKATVLSDAGQGLSAVVVALPGAEPDDRDAHAHNWSFSSHDTSQRGRDADAPPRAPLPGSLDLPRNGWAVNGSRARSPSPARSYTADSNDTRGSHSPAEARKPGSEAAEDLALTVRSRINGDIPIVILAEPAAYGEEDLPEWASQLANEIVFRNEPSCAHVVGRISAKIAKYVDSVMKAAPFFDALVRFAQESHYSWHTPGHSGGQAFLRTPTGAAFHAFFGEPLLRTDLSVSVSQLGSLNDHTGPLKVAEKKAAKLFGADRTYFVTNGTSTSNRVIIGACVTRGDRALVDRNCHKSVIQGMQTTGGIPTFLLPQRNGLGIIGPIRPASLTREAVWDAVRRNPLAQHYEEPDGPVVYSVITNSTYDGLCYHTGMVKELLDPAGVERIHWDEAWTAYSRFHPLYRDRFGMYSFEEDAQRRNPLPRKGQLTRPPTNGSTVSQLSSSPNSRTDAPKPPAPLGPTIFATHSTHKLLAALSQAAMLHVRAGARGNVPHPHLNESFMMQSSTSPQYAIMASIDVAGAMVENSLGAGPGKAGWAGSGIIAASIAEAVRFRRKMARMGESYRAQAMRYAMRNAEKGAPLNLSFAEDADGEKLDRSWWFEVWQPQLVPGVSTVPEKDRKPFLEADIDQLVSDPDCWCLHPADKWHGFEGLQDRYCFLDPIKVTILTPGGNVDGSMNECGIPAAIVTKFLDKRGIQVEKTGDYSMLFLFSLGVTESKWNTLLNSLAEFKRLYDSDTATLSDVLPELVSEYRSAYGPVGGSSPNLDLSVSDTDAEEPASARPEHPVLFSDFCQEMHAFKRGQDQLRLLVRAFDRPPCARLTPAEAYRRLVRNQVEQVPLDRLMGRTAAVAVTPYPPGIPVLMPGECAATGPEDTAVLDYLVALGEFDRRWPGFEHDVHGLEWDERTRRFRVLCVKEA